MKALSVDFWNLKKHRMNERFNLSFLNQAFPEDLFVDNYGLCNTHANLDTRGPALKRAKHF